MINDRVVSFFLGADPEMYKGVKHTISKWLTLKRVNWPKMGSTCPLCPLILNDFKITLAKFATFCKRLRVVWWGYIAWNLYIFHSIMHVFRIPWKQYQFFKVAN